jgi:hypothetical protein
MGGKPGGPEGASSSKSMRGRGRGAGGGRRGLGWIAGGGGRRPRLEEDEVVAVDDFEALAGGVQSAEGVGLQAGEGGDFFGREMSFAAG